MRIHWIFAHPERRSLAGSLLDVGLRELALRGHDTVVSDLYRMGWNPVAGPDDVRPTGRSGQVSASRLFLGREQEHAYRHGGLSADVRAEQDRLRRSDVVVLHFPLWWFGPPAILKGWFDRVLVQGFAFGVTGPDGRVRRYGDGGLTGRRVLIMTSVGARESAFGPRGVHGDVEEVLFPLLHGTAWYTGMAPLTPFVLYGADRLTETGFAGEAERLRERLRALPSAVPIPYRTEAGGDYDEALVLRPGLAPGRRGLGVHRDPSGR